MTYKTLYMKERRRIQRTIRRYIKRGLDVNLVIPKIPKKITAGSVRRLEKITVNVIRESAQGPDYETGEVLDYGRFVSQEKRIRKANKIAKLTKGKTSGGISTPVVPSAYDVIMDNLYLDMEDYDPRAREIVQSAIDLAIAQYGQEAVANVVDDMRQSGEIVTPKQSYNVGAVYQMVTNMRGLLAFSREEMRQLRDFADEDMFSEDEDWFE